MIQNLAWWLWETELAEAAFHGGDPSVAPSFHSDRGAVITPAERESLLDLVLSILPLPSGEPSYRVVVGRRGSDQAVGVRDAYRRRSALAALGDVQRILDSSTPEDAREILQLES